VQLINSQVNENSGVGIRTYSGYVALTRSTIDGNGGTGISAEGAVTVTQSTISNNSGDFAGGILIGAPIGKTAAPLTIINSTASGNVDSRHPPSYGGGGGGIFAYNTRIKISNSTIAYNSSPQGIGGGIRAEVCSGFDLESTLIADNSEAARYAFEPYADVWTDCSVSGSGNFVGVPSFVLPGTLSGPAGLTPLAYHGGAVRTHALLATSNAIDAGNNALGLATDERGLPREAGVAVDIGAYERQKGDDEIFYDGFQ
jgi:hypothetical protein